MMRAFAWVLVFLVATFAGLGSIGQTQPATLGLCVYSVPTPTPSPGAEVAVQCDSNGRIITSGSGGSGGTVTIGGGTAGGTPVPVGCTAAACIVSTGTPYPGTTPIPFPTGTQIVNTPAPAPTGSGGAVAVVQSPAAVMTPVALATASVVLSSSAVARVSSIYVTWDGSQTTTTQCAIALYNSATPTLGTAIIWENVFPLSTVGGTFAMPIPPTLGIGSFTTALSVAVVTAFGGGTSCNTSAGHLKVGGTQ